MGLIHWTQTWLLWKTGGVRNAEQSLERMRQDDEVILPAPRRPRRELPRADQRLPAGLAVAGRRSR